jgi:hypothetical protein
MVGDTLRRMCGGGGGGEARCSALCSIHQPRASLLACFDSLLLLAEGRTVYFGPTGLSDASSSSACGQQPGFLPRALPPFGMPPVPLLLSGCIDSLRTLVPPAQPDGGGGACANSSAAAAGAAVGGVLAYFEAAGYACPRFENPADFLLDLVHRPDVSKLAAMTAAATKAASAQHAAAAAAAAAAALLQQQALLAAPSGKRSGRRRASSPRSPRSPPAGSGGGAREQIDSEAAAPPPEPASPSPPPPPPPDALPAARVATAAAFASLYAASPLAAAAMAPPHASALPPPLPEVGVDGTSRYPTGWCNQFVVLFGRTMRYKLREPSAVLTQACTAVFLPLLVGGIYWRIPFTQNAIQDRLAAVSFLIMLQAFMCMDQILLMPKERAVYLRDHDAGLHSTSAFFLARTAAELPFILGFSAICATEAYFCFGFQRAARRYLTFMAIICAVSEAGAAMLCSVGALSPNINRQFAGDDRARDTHLVRWLLHQHQQHPALVPLGVEVLVSGLRRASGCRERVPRADVYLHARGSGAGLHRHGRRVPGAPRLRGRLHRRVSARRSPSRSARASSRIWAFGFCTLATPSRSVSSREASALPGAPRCWAPLPRGRYAAVRACVMRVFG